MTSDSPGFVVNHAGRAFVTEGLKLLAERGPSIRLDAILRNCAGFRMGPFELLDLTGLDVSVPVMESIHAQYYGDDRYRPVALARTRMVAGLLGARARKASTATRRRCAGASGPACGRSASRRGRVWWPTEGDGALPAELPRCCRPPAAALNHAGRCDPSRPWAAIFPPPSRTWRRRSQDVAIDPVFSGRTRRHADEFAGHGRAGRRAAQQLLATEAIASFVVADSPGYVAPRVVACIVNLGVRNGATGHCLARPTSMPPCAGAGLPVRAVRMGRPHRGEPHPSRFSSGLHDTFGDQRYRPSPWLVRRAGLSCAVRSGPVILLIRQRSRMTNQAFICDAIRTPFGRYGGALSSVRADDLGAVPLKALMARNPDVDWQAVDDVIYGCANQAGEDNRNVARMSALLAGPADRGAGRAPSTACAARAWTRVGTAARAIKAGEARADDRRRRREHEPRALRHAQGRERLQPRQRGVRHHHRLALRQQADEGAVRRRLDARDGRERGDRLQASSARRRTAWRWPRSSKRRGRAEGAASSTPRSRR